MSGGLLDGRDLSFERVSTVDRVAQTLREMIADGRLPQGERLRETPLAASFAVSRNTIRDAIRALAADGLVTHQLHRGAVVTVLRDEDIADIYRVRRVLELRALAAVADGDPQATARVERALTACKAAVADDDYTSFVEHELEFHAALVSFLGSPRLDQLFEQVLGELRLALSVLGADSRPATAKGIAQRYRRIFNAARRGDTEAAQQALADHLDMYERRLRGPRAAAGDQRG
jgi:DNA-binding GntR family transcriptional regulator